ncbi:MAG: cysteine synthase family protein [Nitrospina sp.]|nr:cysteine synthase family protein [Nitrospina sp.]
MQKIGKTILETIGNTPLLCLDGIFIKCEYLNPSGSIKARLAKYMVERAEKEGLLKKGMTIVEASSGNTGNALSLVAAAKGYKMLVVMPEGYTNERVAISKAFGATVKLMGHFQVNEACEFAKKLGKEKGYWSPGQFESEWNVEENAEWLGQEIIGQLPKSLTVDAIVQGVGTGGTLIGVAQALRKYHNSDLQVFAIEPSESATISCHEVSDHLIEGISDGFVPAIYRRHRKEVDEIVQINSTDAVNSMKMLATTYGTFVGPSSGANFLAAKRLKNKRIKNVLTFFCDEGEKYITQHFNSPGS